MNKNSILLGFSAFLLVLGTFLVVPGSNIGRFAADTTNGDWLPSVTTFLQFGFGLCILGLGFVLSWLLESVSGLWFWGVAIATRLVLLRSHPGDEAWRFLWEGYIQNFGFNPYALPPNAAELVAYRPEWWSQIAQPDTAAIFPPLAELSFRLLAAIAPFLLSFKFAFTLADLGICALLCRRFGPLQATFYAWNPLVLYSFAGGAHYDSAFLLLLVAAWLAFERPQPQPKPPGSDFMQAIREAFEDEDDPLPPRRTAQPVFNSPPARQTEHWLGSAVLLGASAAFKGIAWPILGFLAWRAGREVGWKLAATVMLCGILPFAIAAVPFCYTGTCPAIALDFSSLLRERSIAFIPALLADLQPSHWLYFVAVAIAWLAMLSQIKHFRPFAEWYFFIWLVFSPIVQAWYLTWLVPFAVVSRNLGTYWVSLSAFIYFIGPYRQTLAGEIATPHLWETFALWLPLAIGWFWMQKE